jgi:hypothetical protein
MAVGGITGFRQGYRRGELEIRALTTALGEAVEPDAALAWLSAWG